MEPSYRYGIAGVLGAYVVCCGGLLLAASGAVSLAGLASWLTGGGLFWLVVVLAIIGIGLWHRSARPSGSDVREDAITHPLHGPHK